MPKSHRPATKQDPQEQEHPATTFDPQAATAAADRLAKSESDAAAAKIREAKQSRDKAEADYIELLPSLGRHGSEEEQRFRQAMQELGIEAAQLKRDLAILAEAAALERSRHETEGLREAALLAQQDVNQFEKFWPSELDRLGRQAGIARQRASEAGQAGGKLAALRAERPILFAGHVPAAVGGSPPETVAPSTEAHLAGLNSRDVETVKRVLFLESIYEQRDQLPAGTEAAKAVFHQSEWRRREEQNRDADTWSQARQKLDADPGNPTLQRASVEASQALQAGDRRRQAEKDRDYSPVVQAMHLDHTARDIALPELRRLAAHYAHLFVIDAKGFPRVAPKYRPAGDSQAAALECSTAAPPTRQSVPFSM